MLGMGLTLSFKDFKDVLKTPVAIGIGVGAQFIIMPILGFSLAKGFDLEKLRPHGVIYGCNALYRDFTPDVLVAVDHGICHEIYNSGYCQKNEAWFRDWTKVPAMHYDMMIYSSIDKIARDEIKEYYDKHIENERTNAEEFVKNYVQKGGE